MAKQSRRKRKLQKQNRGIVKKIGLSYLSLKEGDEKYLVDKSDFWKILKEKLGHDEPKWQWFLGYAPGKNMKNEILGENIFLKVEYRIVGNVFKITIYTTFWFAQTFDGIEIMRFSYKYLG